MTQGHGTKSQAVSWLRTATALAALLATPACSGSPATYSARDAAAPLHLNRKYELRDVKGRIDHLAIDRSRGLLFVAEHDNGSVDVVDLAAGKVVDHISGLHEPQGVAVAGDQVVVACGDGRVHFYSVASRQPTGQLSLGGDADNVRIDPRNGHAVVGYGSGGLAVIDPETHRILSRTLLPGHPESFLLMGATALVNVPDDGAIVSADFDTGKIVKTWATGTHRLNFPMANEAQQGWFAVAYRMPAAVQLRGVEDGTVRSTVSACGDADDLFIDRDRIFLLCGAGQVDVLSASNPQSAASRVKTAPGARTGLLVPELRTLFIAVPARSEPAAIWGMVIR